MITILAQSLGVPKPHGFSNPPAIEDAVIGVGPYIVIPVVGVMILTFVVRKLIHSGSLRNILLGLLWLPLILWLSYFGYLFFKVYLV